MDQLVFLRIFGVAFGAVLFITSFMLFQRGRIRRLDFLLFILFASGTIIVSVNPDTANILRDVFSLQDREFSRLIALLIFSNFLLWAFFVYARVKFNRRDEQFDLLVRSLGIEEFERRYGAKVIRPVTVILPAYNEAAGIARVLAGMPETVRGHDVAALVIDDGSSDDTAGVARRFGFPAVRSPINRGGGAALRLGYDIAIRGGAWIIVTMDADGQHLPGEIERLVGPIVEGASDFVIGSRVLGRREKDDPVRWAGLHFFNAIINLLAGTRITDCSSGFRAFRADLLRRVTLRQDQYHTTELIIDAARKGIRIGEAPVTILRRQSGRSKKGVNWKYGLSFMKTIIASWWR